MGCGLGMNGGRLGGAAANTAAEAPDPAVRPRSKIYKGLLFGPLRGPNGSFV